MGTKDVRIDAYIAKAQPFAKPILAHLRGLVHKGAPAVEETVKWGFPHFQTHGQILCSMASFKQHLAFGFWKAALLKGAPALGTKGQEAMGQFGRITALGDLPADAKIVAWVKEAAKLNAGGVKVKRAPRAKAKAVKVPPFITRALASNPKAGATWAAFSPSHRREYVEWITEAKTEATKEKRLATALTWLSRGKSRNWKYERPRGT